MRRLAIGRHVGANCIKIPCGFDGIPVEAAANSESYPLDVIFALAQFAAAMATNVIAPQIRRRGFASGLAGYAGAMVLVATAALAGLLIAPIWGNGPVVLLFIPAVLGAAVFFGLSPALVAAVASTLTYNFFFTAPYRTLVIHSPADVMTVVVLFLVAVVTSHLAASLRQQARLAAAHATRNATIAGFARRLLSSAGRTGYCRGRSPRTLAAV